MQTSKLEQVVHSSKNMLSKRTAKKQLSQRLKKNDDSAQDGDCMQIMKDSNNPDMPSLKGIEKDPKNTINEMMKNTMIWTKK